jgi:hypothetical protein
MPLGTELTARVSMTPWICFDGRLVLGPGCGHAGTCRVLLLFSAVLLLARVSCMHTPSFSADGQYDRGWCRESAIRKMRVGEMLEWVILSLPGRTAMLGDSLTGARLKKPTLCIARYGKLKFCRKPGYACLYKSGQVRADVVIRDGSEE